MKNIIFERLLMSITSITGVSIIFLIFIGCGSDVRDRENYGDLAAQGGVQLNSPERHVGGYGRSDCLLCHNTSLNVHQRPGNGIDAVALNRAIQNGGESKYCLNCHGTNGITP